MTMIAKCTLNILLFMRGHHFLNYIECSCYRVSKSSRRIMRASRFAKRITVSYRNRFRTLSGQRSGGDLSASCLGRETRINRSNFGNSVAASGSEIANSC